LTEQTTDDQGEMLKAIFIVLASLLAVTFSACTAERAYYSAQGWQRNQCDKLPDRAEFDRCMSKASATYESYKRQAEPEPK
jgi:hypothetical protein